MLGDAQAGRRLLIEPGAPFRLDLTAWALRRRTHNALDRWDGSSYQRVVSIDGGLRQPLGELGAHRIVGVPAKRIVLPSTVG